MLHVSNLIGKLDIWKAMKAAEEGLSISSSLTVTKLIPGKLLYFVALSHIHQYNNTTIYFYLVINDKGASTAEPSD